ncbi:hypothetical protein BDDG_01701 [Blastomyces dermatitidis ATCC 18188]|uniref:Uncharacterized protein n=1 Tax=Ajellomyces dermatitidis (strain ATCC 18188 / CBS 674.68) TaxID=653446 RepID=F2T6F0_AJEDA|nr:hypothetical protein BDDG_01701 [Blastomyces dermatitidis ATCC 18188]
MNSAVSGSVAVEIWRFDAHVLSVFVEHIITDTSPGLFGFLQLYPTFMTRVTIYGLHGCESSHDNQKSQDVPRESYEASLWGDIHISYRFEDVQKVTTEIQKVVSSKRRSRQSFNGSLLILNRVPPAVIHCLDYELLAPLSKAAELGHVEIVNLLLQQSNVYSHTRDSRNVTPLQYAAAQGNYDVMDLLQIWPEETTIPNGN